MKNITMAILTLACGVGIIALLRCIYVYGAIEEALEYKRFVVRKYEDMASELGCSQPRTDDVIQCIKKAINKPSCQN